jgi:hypothetical protein
MLHPKTLKELGTSRQQMSDLKSKVNARNFLEFPIPAYRALTENESVLSIRIFLIFLAKLL